MTSPTVADSVWSTGAGAVTSTMSSSWPTSIRKSRRAICLASRVDRLGRGRLEAAERGLHDVGPDRERRDRVVAGLVRDAAVRDIGRLVRRGHRDAGGRGAALVRDQAGDGSGARLRECVGPESQHEDEREPQARDKRAVIAHWMPPGNWRDPIPPRGGVNPRARPAFNSPDGAGKKRRHGLAPLDAQRTVRVAVCSRPSSRVPCTFPPPGPSGRPGR